LILDSRESIERLAEERSRAVPLENFLEVGIDVDPLAHNPIFGYVPPGKAVRPGSESTILPSTPPSRMGGVYLHFPFCSYSCTYCYFLKRIQPQEEFVNRYVELLVQEIKTVSSWARGVEVDTVYFGGGTPTYLSRDQLARIGDLVSSSFRLAPDYEWTVEASPETLGAEKAKTLAALGVNRISLGVQTWTEAVLGALARKHSPEQARGAVEAILASGVKRHNVDLIHGIPGQILDDVWIDLQQIARLGIRAVTWYQLYQPSETPLKREMRRKKKSARESLLFRSFISEAMTRMDFVDRRHVFYCRDVKDNNYYQLKRQQGNNFLGLGLGSAGFLEGFHYSNHADVSGYADSIRSCGWGIAKWARLTPEESTRRRILLGITTTPGVPLSLLAEVSSPIRDELDRRIARFVKAGLLEANGSSLRLTGLAQWYADGVADALMAGLDEDSRFRRRSKRRPGLA